MVLVEAEKVQSERKSIFEKEFGNNRNNMSDSIRADYDNLLDQLRKIDPNNKYFENVGVQLTKNKVKLPYCMPYLG
jgi:hypothetical protein